MQVKPVLLSVLFFVASAAWTPAADPAKKAAELYPAAILEFTERGTGMQDQGKNVADVLFATLAANPNLYLVERAELKKVLDELTLSAAGVVAADQATQVGRLTGAKILITGSVFKTGRKNYLVAKVIGTETGKVLGASVNGEEDIPTLAEQLAKKVAETVVASADQLVAKKLDTQARLAQVQKALAGKQLPAAVIKISEVHLGRAAVDPAAETEFLVFYRELGGTVIDPETGAKNAAELSIKGEGFSEFGTDVGAFKSVKARLEVKVTNRAGEVVAADRQTAVAVDLTEIKAGKSALQEAAAQIAERLLPKLAVAPPKGQ